MCHADMCRADTRIHVSESAAAPGLTESVVFCCVLCCPVLCCAVLSYLVCFSCLVKARPGIGLKRTKSATVAKKVADKMKDRSQVS